MSDKKFDTLSTESSIAKKDYDYDEESAIETFETPAIKFSDTEHPSGKNGSKLNRRLSIHSLAKSERSDLFTIRERVNPEVILPTAFRTVSHHVENEIENEAKPNTTASKFVGVTFHLDPYEKVIANLGTDLTYGLSDSQSQKILKERGLNVQSKPPNRLLKKLFMYFFGGFGALLLTGGILCIIAWKPLGNPSPAISNLILGIILLVVFILQAMFNFFQDFSSSRVMDSIHNMIPTETLVTRGGKVSQIDSKYLVPGDIIKFSTGLKIPADVRICEATPELSFDRSILTGESNAIPATYHADTANSNYLESTSIAMQGTFVLSGSGKGVVVATGDNTIFGTIAKMASRPKKGLTPMQWEILRFVLLTTGIIVVLVVLIVILWCAWLRKDHKGWLSVSGLIVDIVSIAVAFIPEGLPIALTTCLIITASKMRKSKILCKSLSTVETLGSVSVLCFDKTGTLTKNDMMVTDVCKGITTEVCNTPKEKASLESEESLHPMSSHFFTIASLCNDGFVDGNGEINGNATDKAILRYTEDKHHREDLERPWNGVFDIAFNSKDKYMAKLLKPNPDVQSLEKTWADVGMEVPQTETNLISLLTVKGAPDILMENCTYILEQHGAWGTKTKSIDDETKSTIKGIQQEWSRSGKRVILLASKLINQNRVNFDDRFLATQTLREEISTDLTFVGMFGIEDPPRKNADKVVRQLRDAGIKIAMITGDYELTGLSIAKQIGIVSGKIDYYPDVVSLAARDSSSNNQETTSIDAAVSISGPDLNLLTEAEWARVIRYDELVFTRTTPEQKLLIIKEFQKNKQIIGMTGDGINDSPSLKQADVGISLVNASDIAKEASDLILMSDGEQEDELFLSIIEALKFGRLVFENLRKTIGYLLPAGTYAELWPVLMNVIFGMPQMLSSFLMIIICCVTDCAGAIIIAYEPSEKNLLKKKPRSITKEKLVDWKLFLHSYFTIGTYYCFVSFLLAFLNLTRRGFKFSQFSLSYGTYESLPNVENYVNMSSSIYFVNLVMMQFFNLCAMRSRYLSIFTHSPLMNKRIFFVIPFALGVTFIINYIPAIHTSLGTSQVPVEYYFISFGFGCTVLIYDELRKLCNRKYPNGCLAKIAW